MAGGQILAFPIDIDRRPYNTLALPCECVIIIIIIVLGASYVLLSGVCRRLSPVVVICNTPWRRICNVAHQGAARDSGPVV